MAKRVLALFCLLIAILLAGYLPERTLRQIPTLSYVQPACEELHQRLNCTGTVIAAKEVELYLGVAVYPTTVNGAVGDWVEKGQPLAILDLELTQAMLAQSQAIPVEAFAGTNAQLLQVLKGQMGNTAGFEKQLEALLGKALQQQDRILYLPKEMTAPFSGVLSAVSLQEGHLSQAGDPAFILTDPASYYILAQIPQSRVEEVVSGSHAIITAVSNEEQLTGKVTKIYPTATPSLTGGEPTVAVEIQLDEHADHLRGGYNVRVQIETTSPYQALTLPYEAVDQDDDGEYVYCINQAGRAERHTITTGKQALGRVEVIEGVAETDVVLLSPQQVDPDAAVVWLQRGERD